MKENLRLDNQVPNEGFFIIGGPKILPQTVVGDMG